MKENVLNLQVVLADGRVVHTAGLRGRARCVVLATTIIVRHL